MRHSIIALAVILTASSVGAHADWQNLTPQQKIAHEVRDRIEGTPVDCIKDSDVEVTLVIDRTAIAYEAGDTVYLNYPSNAQTLKSEYTIVRRVNGDLICRGAMYYVETPNGDIVSTVDIDKFVPYRTQK
jgi:hypothetical protein